MKHAAGFTLLELVTVMVLLGILSTFIAVRTGSDFKAARDAEELIQAIRHTQERAMHHTGDGQSYQITIGGAGYNLMPAASAIYANVLDGVLEGSSVSPTGVIAFDGLGKPTCSGGLVCASSAQSFELSASGDSVTLTLEPETGYVRR